MVTGDESLPSGKIVAELQVTATLQDVRKLCEQARAIVEQLCANLEFVNCIELAVAEFANNVVIHGYAEQRGDIRLVITQRPDGLTLIFSDSAWQFDPTPLMMNEGLGLDMNAVTETSLGMGLQIVKSAMDSIEYQPLAVGNQLTMFKRYPAINDDAGNEST